ncbi:MAG: hypothetical protein K0U39_10005 [Alphaproteobacteria bacterium]|nr:hypothetical protein [Alphaproteobacteria bacterium]
MQQATPKDATMKHHNAITPRNSANGASDYKIPNEETRLALGNILTTPPQPIPDIASKHSDEHTTDIKSGSKLPFFTIYMSAILWIIAMVTIGLSAEMQTISLIESIQFFALAFMPLLLLSMLLINLRNNARNTQILRDQQNVSALPAMPLYHSDNGTSATFNDTMNQHNAMMQQTEGNLKNMITMVDERIKAMRSLSTTAEAEFQNITEHMGKALRDNLGKISQSTQESMGELKNVVNVIQDREENLSKLTQHFTTIEKDIGEMLEKRQRDIRQQIEQQIGGILSGFDEIKKDMDNYQKNMLQDWITQNSENKEQINVMISSHDDKINQISDNIHKRQEDLIANFENSNNGMYLRIQKILHELNVNNDQLVNRVEARQVQMRDLLGRNNEHFTSLFDQYNTQYNDMCQNIMTMLQDKGSELTSQVSDGLSNFTDIFKDMEAQRLQNEQHIEVFLKNHSQQITEKLSTHHTHNYDIISDHFSNHQNWMSNLVDSVQKYYADFQQHANDYKTTFEQTIGNAAQSTKQLGKNVRDELEQVITSVNHASSHVNQLTGNFSNAFDKLETVNNKSEIVLNKVDKSLGQHISRLTENTEKLENCSQLVENNFTKHANKINQISDYVKESQGKAFDDLVQTINERLTFLQNNIQQHATIATRSLNDSINKQSELMTASLQKNIDNIEKGGAYMNDTLAKTGVEVIQKFSAQGKQVETQVIQLLHKLLKSSKMLDQGVGKIDGLITNTDDRVDNLKTIIQKQTTFYEALLQRMEQNSGSLRTEIQADQEKLVHAIREAEEKASLTKGTLMENSDFFIEKTDDIVNRFQSIHEKMTQHMRMVSDISTQAQSHCTQMDDKLRDQVDNLQTAINSHNNSLTSAFNPAMDKLTNVSEQIQEKASHFHETFQQSVEKVDNISNHLAIRGEKILNIFTNAESSIDKSADKLTHSAVQMRDVAKDVERHSSTFETIVQAQLREIDQYGQDFETRINDLNGSLGRYLNSIKEQGNQFSAQFIKNSDSFHHTAEKINQTFGTAIGGLTKNSSEFENNLRRLLTSLQQTGTLVQNHSNQISVNNQKMNEFDAISKQAVDRVIEKLSNLSGAFDKVTERMNHNIVKLSATIADKQSGMLSVSDKMQNVQEQLVNQCREAMNITNQASEVFKSLPHHVNADVNINTEHALPQDVMSQDVMPAAMPQNRDAVVTTITTPEKGLPPRKPEMQPEQRLVQHETSDENSPPAHKVDDIKYRNFMNSARNLIEDLHKTSVELSRNLLDKAEFKNIDNDYKKGKRNAFTLHLLNRNNNDFANHISGENLRNIQTKQLLETYQNKFESLMHSSKEFSPDNSLATDFSLSDIGKLYTMLAKIVGRNTANNTNNARSKATNNIGQDIGVMIN